MDELIKTHNFEVAKKRLQEFSQKEAKELELDSVQTDGGLFGLGNHKVTGDELNNRLSVIQQHLIDLNNTNNQTIKEFEQIYNAFVALDKDYIEGIVASIKATEKTSKGIESAQKKIGTVVDRQKKTLEVLQKFKQRIEKYTHLKDIDKLWDDCQKWPDKISELSDSIEEVKSKLSNSELEIENEMYELTTRVGELENELVDAYKDIEEVKNGLCNAESNIEEVKNGLCNAEKNIKYLTESVKIVEKDSENIGAAQKQIKKDVDELRDSNQSNSSRIAELQKQGEETKAIVQNNKELVDVVIGEVMEKNDTAVQELAKKIKYAYFIAGGSIGIAILELVILFMKVI